MRPSRRDVQRALREVEELWKPPEDRPKIWPATGDTETGRGDREEDRCDADYSTAPDEASAEDQVNLARQRFANAKRNFITASRAAVAGRADPGAVPAALRQVDNARAALREAELALRAANRGAQ